MLIQNQIAHEYMSKRLIILAHGSILTETGTGIHTEIFFAAIRKNIPFQFLEKERSLS